MLKNNPKKKATILLFLLTGGLLLVWYGNIIFRPGAHLFGNEGDGLKNYFTPWYHVKHDSTFTWFEGMNYPYGDHVVFADAQPLVSNTLKAVNAVVDISDHTIGILNLLMLLSPLLTAWFLFLILRRFGIKPLFSAVAAAAIALMSPQMMRMTGHYALAYSFFIPMVWYLAIRTWEFNSFKWPFLVAGVLFLSAWVHPYYLMIGAVFLTFAWFIHFLLYSRRGEWAFYVLYWAVQVVLPLVLFKLILGWTDPITDRPVNPYGFEEFYATWKSILLPFPLPGMDFLEGLKGVPEESWEGISYIGVLGTFSLILFFIGMVSRFLRKRPGRKSFWQRLKLTVAPSRNKILTVSVLAAVCVAIFACGFPFAIKPDRLTEIFPPIKQFRSLGRFAWAFYYVWSVFGFWLIYAGWRKFRLQGKAALGMLMLIPGVLFFGESVAYQYSVKSRITHTDQEPTLPSRYADLLEKTQIQNLANEYDALLVLPYFHIGSENLYASDPVSEMLAFKASMRTGLPLMNSMMSRTSFEQAWKQLQLVSLPISEPEIIEDIPEFSKVMILNTLRKGTFDGCPLTRQAPQLPLIEEGGRSIFLEDADPNKWISRANFDCRSPLGAKAFKPIAGMDGIYISAADEDFHFDGFDDAPNDFAFRGKGGLQCNRAENNFFYEGKPTAQPGDTLVASIWVKMRGDRLPLTYFGLEEKDPAGNDVVWDYSSLTDYVVALGKEWALCERKFVLHGAGNSIRLNITRWQRKPPLIEIDEFMLRRQRTWVLDRRDPAREYINNRPAPVRQTEPQP